MRSLNVMWNQMLGGGEGEGWGLEHTRQVLLLHPVPALVS